MNKVEYGDIGTFNRKQNNDQPKKFLGTDRSNLQEVDQIGQPMNLVEA